MKKFISVVLAAALTFSAIGAFAVPQQSDSDDTQSSASTTPIVSAYGKTDDSTVLLGTGVSAQNIPSTVSESASAAVTITSDGTALYSGDLPTTDDGDTGMLRFGLSQAVVAKSVSVNGSSLSAEDWFTGADSKALYISSAKLSGESISIEITADTTAASVYTLGINTFADAEFTENGATYRGSAISVFGKAVGNVDEFGVLFGRTEAEVTEYSSDYTQGGNAYPALAKDSNGEFVVQLIDASSLPAAVYACAYYKSGSSYTYGAVKQVSSLPQIESFKLGSYVGTIDQSTKTITVEVPNADTVNGGSINNLTGTVETSFGVDKITLDAKKNSVTNSVSSIVDMDTVTFNSGSSDCEYTAQVQTSGMTDGLIKLYANDKLEAYKLVVIHSLVINFDDLTAVTEVGDGFTGFTNANALIWQYSGGTDGSVWRNGTYFSLNEKNPYVNWISAYPKSEKSDYDDHLKAKSIKFVDYTTVKDLSDSTKNMDKGVTEVSGKVLAINNPSNGNTSTNYDNYGEIAFNIGTATQFRGVGIEQATTLRFEYDVAYQNNPTALNSSIESNSGRISPFRNGAYVYSGTGYDSKKTTPIARIGGGTSNWTGNSDFKHGYSSSDNAASGDVYSVNYDVSKWRRVGCEFNRNYVGDGITSSFYYDGEKQTNTGTITGTKWPSQISFKGDGTRACQTYIDNIKIIWNIAADYSDADDISTLDIAGATTEIDRTNNVINVAFPIYSVVDGSILTLGSAKAYASSLNGSEVKLGTTAITAGGTDIDWSNVSSDAKITVGEKEYTLNVQRRLFDDFDGNTYISGRAQGTLDSSKCIQWSEGITNKLSSVYSIGKNDSGYNSTTINDTDKKTLAENLFIGVYPVSDAKAVASDKKFTTVVTDPMPADAAAAPNGNGFKLLKKLSYGTTADSYAGKFIITTGNIDGISAASDMSVEFDMAYDYSETTKSFTFNDGTTTVNIGNNSAGFQFNGSGDGYRATNSANNLSTDNRATNKLAVFKKEVANATLDKWNHVKITANKTSENKALINVYVNGVLIDDATTTLEEMPTSKNMEFMGTTRRACAVWIDNLDIRYNVN